MMIYCGTHGTKGDEEWECGCRAPRFAIKNTSGQWWTGSCWGAEQAREVYDATELPDIIDADNAGEDIALRCDSCTDNPTDILYFRDLDADAGDDTNPEAVASVREVK